MCLKESKKKKKKNSRKVKETFFQSFSKFSYLRMFVPEPLFVHLVVGCEKAAKVRSIHRIKTQGGDFTKM